MKSKVMTRTDMTRHFRDGMSIMFGGFMGSGTPPAIMKMLFDSGVKDLTLIGNDTAIPGLGVAPLIEAGRVRKVIASHIGLNPETGRQMMAGEMEVELVPQGTLVERIRAGGAGLGGFLTPTGVGTVVEQGKQRMTIDGRDYLLELPLKADLAVIHAKRGDTAGNLYYRRSARNFNPIIALAAERVFAEVEELVNVGDLDPDMVMTPGMLVSGLITGDE
ncbi:Acetate CoA-transferase subunit alpha [Pragia fontium]|uniref:Acetate CoA/acetoacetate CoA-transferase alpha subunit n=1 Tax=Pragia fontium DSM 5563 = ATCC 49100 TaxID=1122977 RepID=A0AAJ5BIR0_9GAMM|nr:acetate CoA-transferase subunit alpha [Pragia fontium]AKJ43399.1 acetyl-CoA:acetoacetyl-CoA transferase subunit alpha [Pragia fontium]SFD47549.1 acetate CoA/acetoacetate CoA-transferase alpha subunit [Pragia fontium DSM 5563 = ATCC 49100]SUB83873.1 Acetate CoA-transferase subunit alpha [Pragia fontium]